MKKRLIVLPVNILMVVASHAQLPSFPGAEGWGALSLGGRGGVVIEVTNLNDSGEGSLREACNTQGARTVVFRTGGIISLKSELQLVEPYVTIAGQTAPGDGIVIKDFPFSVSTHNVIVRGMRFRAGDDVQGARPDIRDCFSVQAGAHDIIVDHCSFSWGLDENVEIMNSHHITIQWCVISEGLYRSIHPKGPHGMGMLITNNSLKTSIHHNLFAHNFGRNPLIIGNTDHEFINNTVYDWGYASEFHESGTVFRADIIGNKWIPLTTPLDPKGYPLKFDFCPPCYSSYNSKVYCANNESPSGAFFTSEQLTNFGNLPVFSDVSLVNSSMPVTILSLSSAYESVLKESGAIHPRRDTVDRRIIAQVVNAQGGLVDCILRNPILLDSGQVLNATNSSLIYSQIDRNPAISPEARKIEIVNGTGAGQSRVGVSVSTLDQEKRIVEAYVDMPWSVKPDSTSSYSITATCDNAVGSWPHYASGTPAVDSDKDGMPDDWETENFLDPMDASDRNGANLDAQGYTNLEVYLNGLYTQNALTSLVEKQLPDDWQFLAFPNPFTEAITITINPKMHRATLILYDVTGRELECLKHIYGSEWTLRRGNLMRGIYYLQLIDKGAFSPFYKIVISD